MKQIEVTVKLKETMDSAIKKLEKLGFENIRESNINDIYMTQLKKYLNRDNIQYILSNSVLLRNLKINGKEIRKITYKNKEYDSRQVISEQKISIDCDNLERAQILFECLKFEKLIQVKYNVLVMAKAGIELAFQDVENLGILIEYENTNDFSEKSVEEIKNEKDNMYNFIKRIGIDITEEKDIKKALELINKSYF